MARRTKPCFFCEEEWVSENDAMTHDYEGGHHHSAWFEVYPFNHFMTVISHAQSPDSELDEIMFDINLNYCPECGRKLT